MPHIILAIGSLVVLLVLVKPRRILQLIKGGIIGGVFAGTVDYFGDIFNLYRYKRVILPIAANVSIFHILSMSIVTIIYLNWIPKEWHRRLGYTAYWSGISLLLEAVMYQAGAIVYINWPFWYSYLLDIAGLTVVSYLSDYATAPA